ncbi:MAG: hypothetical protein CVV42_01130 [Candidatus Riflebacteria bacterium HGW-Riflebacteria-2]|nr:MAG: hypothetical protein CVV42_01130 [Candidatus Riflebacteria bacterium HGW-Riflebacteria-2]
MRKLTFLVFLLLLLSVPAATWAGAYEQLLSISGGSANVPDVPDPTPVEPSNYSSYQEPSYNYVDPAEQRRREERRRQRQKANERRAREARERRREQERAESKKERDEREAKRQIVLKQLPPKWQLKSSAKKSPVAGKVPPLSGLSELSSMHEQVEALQKNGSLNSQQQAELAGLDRKMFDLWSQMVSAADTPERVRKVLRLPIGFADSTGVPKLSQEKLRELIKAQEDSAAAAVIQDAVPVKNGLVNFASDYLQGILAAAPAEIFEAATDAELGALLKNGVALAKVTLAFRDKSKGIASVADFAVGRIAIPHAAVAEAGRKIYTNVAFASLNNFMEKASSSVGETFDRAAFWKNLKEEATTGQRSFIEWLGAK